MYVYAGQLYLPMHVCTHSIAYMYIQSCSGLPHNVRQYCQAVAKYSETCYIEQYKSRRCSWEWCGERLVFIWITIVTATAASWWAAVTLTTTRWAQTASILLTLGCPLVHLQWLLFFFIFVFRRRRSCLRFSEEEEMLLIIVHAHCDNSLYKVVGKEVLKLPLTYECAFSHTTHTLVHTWYAKKARRH